MTIKAELLSLIRIRDTNNIITKIAARVCINDKQFEEFILEGDDLTLVLAAKDDAEQATVFQAWLTPKLQEVAWPAPTTVTEILSAEDVQAKYNIPTTIEI